MTIELSEVDKEKIEALEYAKDRIVREKSNFICYALPETVIGLRLRDFVRGKLKGHETLEDWAVTSSNAWARISESKAERLLYSDLEITRKARIRWIDAMILAIKTQTEVKGDWE